MTNATKTLGLVFLASLLLLGLNLIFGNPGGDSEVFRGDLIEADTSRINRIVIKQGPDTEAVTLSEKDNSWQVEAGGAVYAADPMKAFDFLTEIQNLEIRSLVTRNPENHARYLVDSTGIRLGLYRDEQTLDELIVGAGEKTGSTSYVRHAGADEVFAVDALNRLPAQADVNFWRDRTIWDVPEETITEVRFDYPADSSFTIHKENGTWFSQSDSLNQVKTGSLINQVESVEAVEYTGEEGTIADPLYTIRIIRDNGREIILNLKPQQEEDRAPYYLAQTGESPYLFTLNKRIWDRTVVLRREELLAE